MHRCKIISGKKKVHYFATTRSVGERSEEANVVEC